MTEVTLDTAIDYFSAHEDYFWRWAEHGRVIEFANKKTICYREELTYLLGELPGGTHFPLGSLLLMLCACKENWESLFEVEQQLMRLSLAEGFAAGDYLRAQQMKEEGLGFLKVINSLAPDDRTGIRRTELIAAVISSLKTDQSLPEIHAMLKDLDTSELDYTILRHRKKLDFKIVEQDLAPLARAYTYFPDKEALELKLRTGLNVLPKKAPLVIPEESGADLLGQLYEDAKTRMLSGLTRKILAAIRIPMHLAGSSDLSLGGVADISNRGPYDKLLLSELAQDDHLLTARLANNEALFLQRERTPDNAVQELGVFIDTTLKMWGLPRVMALATGLAFREGKQQNQRLQVWAIGGTENRLLDLNAKNGVIAALSALDPALNCAAQLFKTIREQTAQKGKYILVTGEDFLQDAAMSATFHQVREQLSFLVTAGHDGHIRLFKLDKGKLRLLNEALIDPFTEQHSRQAKSVLYQYAGLPAIMQEPVFPLYYPASKVKLNHQTSFVTANKTVVVVTQDRRVLYWPVKDAGAVELIGHLPSGAYCFGETHEDVYILVNSSKSEVLSLYFLNLRELTSELYEVAAKQQTGYNMKFLNQDFYLMGSNGLDILDPGTLQYLMVYEADVKFFNEQQSVTPHYKNFNVLKKQINSGYSVINSAKSVYLHTAARLFLDKRGLNISRNNFYWKEDLLAAVEWVKPVKEELVSVEHLPNVKLTKYNWTNGSWALLDSRGVLHLKSVDNSVPEISVLLVVDHYTACWCSDGVVSGPAYFTSRTNLPQIDPSEFYKNYIQRFLDALK